MDMTEGEKRPMSARRKRNRRRYYAYEISSVLLYGLFLFLICLAMIFFVAQKTVVEGSSMSPALEDGDNLIVDKLSYRFTEARRYDIVVFQYPEGENSYYIKRIIGLPGETVLIEDGQVYINGELLGENYGAKPMENPGRANSPVTLGEDEYFVLGDNRSVSADSRDPAVGNVSREQIVGKAFVCIYPFDRLGFLRHQ